MSTGGRRVIQPPGGASNIFFGSEEPRSNGNGRQQPSQTQKAEVDSQKKQTAESSESTLGRTAYPDQSGHANNESTRNKDRQKSSIVFGNEDTASQSAAHNKAGQTHRNYNLITGETNAEESAPKKTQQNGKSANEKDVPAAGAGGNTSIKVHHPPGGKSSGPLW